MYDIYFLKKDNNPKYSTDITNYLEHLHQISSSIEIKNWSVLTYNNMIEYCELYNTLTETDNYDKLEKVLIEILSNINKYISEHNNQIIKDLSKDLKTKTIKKG